MEETLNLKKVLTILKRKAGLIVFLTILSALLAGGVSYYLLTPIYQTSTQILVNQEQIGTESPINQNIQTDLQLINTYSGIIKSPIIQGQVIDKLGLDISVDRLNNAMTVNSASDSQIIEISVTHADPETGVQIANMTAAVFQEEIQELMNINNVSVLSPAVLKPDLNPVGPSPLFNMVIAALAGFMIGAGMAFLLSYLDTTIKNEDDILEVLDIPILAVISPIAVQNPVKVNKTVALKQKEA